MLKPQLAMSVSSLAFPLIGVLIRKILQLDEVFTDMFHSSLINCAALWTVLWVRERGGAFMTPIPRVHLLRGLLHLLRGLLAAVGATTIVYSMKYMQVDLALTLLMSISFWSVLLARFWICDRV